MPSPTRWIATLASTDMTAEPVDLDSPNVVDVRRYKSVVLSATISGGEQVKLEIYKFISSTSTFVPTGEVVVLDAAYGNLAVLPTTGLYIGLVATAHNGATTFDLAVGVYDA